MELHRVSMELHRISPWSSMELRRTLWKIPMDLHRNAIQLHRNSMELHRNAMELHRNAMELYRNSLELHRNSMDLHMPIFYGEIPIWRFLWIFLLGNFFFRYRAHCTLTKILQNGSIHCQYSQNVILCAELTDDEVTAQAMFFFSAGFESSSSLMSFALLELAVNPDIQKRAQNDIDAVLKRHDGKITYQAIQEMTFLDWIMQGMVLFKII
jgi:hypothetical protein